jgi:hypothetical protein
VNKTEEQSEVSANLSYSEYQRRHEVKLLNQLSQNAMPPPEQSTAQPSSSASEVSSTDIGPDATFFESIENQLRQYAQAINRLKVAKQETRKEDYISAASAIYARADSIIDEIRTYYLFESIPDTFTLHPNDSTFNRHMMKFTEDIYSAANELITRSKIASGVWPPPDATTLMVQGTVPCIVGVKDMVMYVKQVALVSRQTENEERRKMENFMREWVQSQHVRDLFKQWETLQLKALNVRNDHSRLVLMCVGGGI